MAACYTADVTFQDPVFGPLVGPRVSAMWHMLCERATDLRVEVRDIVVREDRGSARWDAWYTFTQTGRSVHNRIDASFEFAGGLIRRHTDVFDFYAWTRQALGMKGLLLGWAPPVQRAIRAQAARGLDAFCRRQGL